MACMVGYSCRRKPWCLLFNGTWYRGDVHAAAACPVFMLMPSPSHSQHLTVQHAAAACKNHIVVWLWHTHLPKEVAEQSADAVLCRAENGSSSAREMLLFNACDLAPLLRQRTLYLIGDSLMQKCTCTCGADRQDHNLLHPSLAQNSPWHMLPTLQKLDPVAFCLRQVLQRTSLQLCTWHHLHRCNACNPTQPRLQHTLPLTPPSVTPALPTSVKRQLCVDLAAWLVHACAGIYGSTAVPVRRLPGARGA